MIAASRERMAWAFLAPMLVIMAVVTGFPILNTVWLAFTDAGLTGRGYDWNWVGSENFVYLARDENFRAALGHTFYFTFVSVSIEMILGLFVALLLNERFAGCTLLRAMLIMPWALPTIVNAMMWRLIYNPDFGSFNALLVQLGVLDSYRSWLGDPATAMNMIILADIWKNYPLIALIILGALQTVPQELYEAARLDGAGWWSRLWHVTLPGIIGPVSVALILRTIEAFKVFDVIYVMTRGGPADVTKTASFFVYQESFSYLRAGSGASYAVAVTLISGTLIAAYVLLLRRSSGAS
jgi:multiple sugar transport system permease protein